MTEIQVQEISYLKMIGTTCIRNHFITMHMYYNIWSRKNVSMLPASHKVCHNSASILQILAAFQTHSRKAKKNMMNMKQAPIVKFAEDAKAHTHYYVLIRSKPKMQCTSKSQ